MFTLAEELKYYEPGLEVVEDSLSGEPEKDLLEMMRILLKEKASASGSVEKSEATPETAEGTASV